MMRTAGPGAPEAAQPKGWLAGVAQPKGWLAGVACLLLLTPGLAGAQTDSVRVGDPGGTQTAPQSGVQRRPAAAPDTLRVTGDISKSVVKIGERVSIKLGLELPEPSARIIAPPAPVNFGPLDVVASDSIPAGPDSAAWQVDLAFFQLGELDVNMIPFALETSTGVIPVRLNSYVISVVSILPDTLQNAEIKDIKGPLDIPLRPRWWRILLATLVLAAIVLAGVWWYRRRREQVSAAVPFVPSVPPETLALRALRDLEDEAYPARGLIKEHYARLSLILREYMEGRFRVPAVESTTDEIRDSLAGRKLFSSDSESRLLVILDEADLVKFAKFNPGMEAATEALEGGRSWVESTTRSSAVRPPADGPGTPADPPGSPADRPEPVAVPPGSPADRPEPVAVPPGSPADRPESSADSPETKGDPSPRMKGAS